MIITLVAGEGKEILRRLGKETEKRRGQWLVNMNSSLRLRSSVLSKGVSLTSPDWFSVPCSSLKYESFGILQKY